MARKNPIISLFKDLVNLGLESFGKYYSIYRGYVYDRNDPLNLGRVQLVIPQVTGNAPYKYWAMPINVFSGKNYGSQVLPNKGDLVWVQFEGGHPEVPIWSHGHFGKGEIPNDPDLQDKNSYWFLSPKGNLVILNDTKNYIKVKSLLGDRLELNEKGIYVSFNSYLS